MKRTFTRNPYMTLRRLLILVLVFSMAAGLFVGCKQQEENNDPGTPPGLVAGEETKPSTEPAENPTDATEPDGTAPVELEENFAVITADQVNVRAAPSAEATVIDQLFKGDVVEIEDQKIATFLRKPPPRKPSLRPATATRTPSVRVLLPHPN